MFVIESNLQGQKVKFNVKYQKNVTFNKYKKQLLFIVILTV